MDEDQILQSIIADPQLTDPSIDVGKLRQTTPTRAELLANVPEFSGLKFDFTKKDYIRDLYSIYGGGLPMVPEPVVEAPAVTTPVVDTSAMDQVTGDSILDAPTTTPITTPTVTQPLAGGGPDIATIPAITTPISGDSITVQNIAQNQTPYDVPMSIDDPGASIENIIAQQNLSTIPAAPVVNPNLQIQGPTTIEGALIPGDTPGVNPVDEVALTGDLTGASPEQQNLIDRAFSTIGSTANDIMRDLSEIPGAAADFVGKTVDIGGAKINVGKTLLSAGINRIVGGPISLVFDAVGALAANLPSGISETTNKAREVGLIQGDGTATQDKYGINTQSAFGNYNQYNIDRVEFLENKINKTQRDIQELEERKEYVRRSGASGDIQETGDASVAEAAEAEGRQGVIDTRDQMTGVSTGDASVAEAIAAADRAAAAAEAERAAARREAARTPAPAPAPTRDNGGGGARGGGSDRGGTSATSSGLGGLGFSDIRLKDNVELIGKSPSNINIYKFNYKGNPTIYQGAMAHEVPWASVKANNGYLMIDYNKIDVEFKQHAK